jgi:hypothetical protein
MANFMSEISDGKREFTANEMIMSNLYMQYTSLNIIKTNLLKMTTDRTSRIMVELVQKWGAVISRTIGVVADKTILSYQNIFDQLNIMRHEIRIATMFYPDTDIISHISHLNDIISALSSLEVDLDAKNKKSA